MVDVRIQRKVCVASVGLNETREEQVGGMIGQVYCIHEDSVSQALRTKTLSYFSLYFRQGKKIQAVP